MNLVLVRAIQEKRLIEFIYKSGAVRIAEPHDYGILDGVERLLAFQLSGDFLDREATAVRSTGTGTCFLRA